MLLITFSITVAFTYFAYLQIRFTLNDKNCPTDNTWHTCGTVPLHFEPTKNQQNKKSSKLAMVCSTFYQNVENAFGDWVHGCVLRRSRRYSWFRLVIWGLLGQNIELVVDICPRC